MKHESKGKRLSKLDAAYIAGIVDGEGCVMLHRRKNTKSFTIILTVSNTDFGLAPYLKSTTGTGDKQRVVFRKGNRRPQMRWTVRNADAVHVLNQIVGYMRIKHKQAKRVLLAYERFLYRGCFYLTEKDMENLIILTEEIRRLNSRGKNVV